MSHFWPEVPAEQMTQRARLYLLVVTFYCFAMAFGQLFFTEWFKTPNFERINDALPFQFLAWAIIHICVGATALYAGVKGSSNAAYHALIAAFVIVGLWAFLFVVSAVFAVIDDKTAGWSGAVVYSSLALTHLIQARQPIRSPFDPFIRDAAAKDV